jgi:hypothetical protein
MTCAVYRWTPENLQRARQILGEHRELKTAFEAIADEVGFDVTRHALDSAFEKAGWSTPFSYLKKRERRIPPVDARDTERMECAPVVELPDDSGTTVEDEPVSSAAELAAHRQRAKISDLESAKKRLLADLADREEQIAILKELRAARPLPPITERKVVDATQRQGVPVMLCSDWHVEEPVDPAHVNGLNEYTLEIADRCIDRMADAYEWLLRDTRYDCREGIIWLGGDLMSGYIHAELEESNFLSPVEATLWLQERVERMLRKIAANCQTLERIIVVCNDGNHGRLSHKIRVGTRTANSIEWLLYHNIAARLSDDPRFEFRIADGEYSYVDLYDNQTLLFFHGDSVRYVGGVGGLLIPMKRGLNELRKYRPFTVANFGHFHQRLDMPDMVGNGSMIGTTSFSMRYKFTPEPRQQSFYIIDSRRGKSISAPIWL